jgi:hypothetical protein
MTDIGRTLAELKARTGLTWDQLAGTLGASSGDYVRKVARGAKPGRNLATNVAELMSTGSVRAAVPRRRAASGQIARVRAPAIAEAPSRRPAETAIVGEGRRLFRTASGRMGWQQDTGTSTGDFMAAVTSAGRGQHRVRFRVKLTRPTGRGAPFWTDVGARGGYTSAQVRAGVRKYGSVTDWLASQMGAKGTGSRGSADDIRDVEIIAE